MNVNIYFKSAWCLFVGNTADKPVEPKVINEENEKNFFDHTPYNFLGKSFTWADTDIKMLASMRKWIKKYFSEDYVINTDYNEK